MVRFLIILSLVLSTSCGRKEEIKKEKKAPSVLGTWINTSTSCEGTKCECTNTMTFNANGTFEGIEKCNVKGQLLEGEYGGVYEYESPYMRMYFYDGRGEYYNFVTVYNHKIEMLVGNKIKLYLRGNPEAP